MKKCKRQLNILLIRLRRVPTVRFHPAHVRPRDHVAERVPFARVFTSPANKVLLEKGRFAAALMPRR